MNYGSDIPKVQRCNAPPYAIEFGDGFDYERRDRGFMQCQKILYCPLLHFGTVMDGNSDNLACSLAMTKGTRHFNMLGNLEGKNSQLFCSS